MNIVIKKYRRESKLRIKTIFIIRNNNFTFYSCNAVKTSKYLKTLLSF